MDLRNQSFFFLSVNDVRDASLTLTIGGHRNADPADPRKRPIVCFREDGWALPLNKSNLRTVIAAFGWQTNNWLGKKVVAYFDDSITFEGQMVGGVRLKVEAEEQRQPIEETAAEAGAM
jgi:hypothetical protein